MPASRSVDVQALLNEHPFSGYRWLIFALCFCIVLLDGFDTAVIGYIAPSLVAEWGAERPALAPVLSAALFGLAAGTIMNTAQSSLPALAAGFYPTKGRATGVAWMPGLGRFGGIAGSFLVAELARRQLTFSEIFAIVAVPGLIAAVALTVKQVAHPEGRSAHAIARSEALGH